MSGIRLMRVKAVYILILLLVATPLHNIVMAMPVPSGTVDPERGEVPAPEAGGYHYYYWDHDPVLLVFETLLYIGIIVSALIILDQHTDGLTIIVYD
jgi:hypothetical protein